MKLTRVEHLKHFPSASSIEYANNRFYLVGDDAQHIYVLDDNFRHVDSLLTQTSATYRVHKELKWDLEASGITRDSSLLCLGSSSTANRQLLLVFQLNTKAPPAIIAIGEFKDRVKQSGIKEINFEGLTFIKEKVLIGNRGNLDNPVNHLVITQEQFYEKQLTVPIHTATLLFSNTPPDFAGLSGMAYDAEEDVLWLTASTELTTSTYDDGAIGTSYLGKVKNISTKLTAKAVVVDELYNLNKVNNAFRNHKVESVCIRKINGKTELVLVSDNDNGESTIFCLVP